MKLSLTAIVTSLVFSTSVLADDGSFGNVAPNYSVDNEMITSFEETSLRPFWAPVACVKATVDNFLGGDVVEIDGNTAYGYVENNETFSEYMVFFNKHEGESVFINSLVHGFATALSDDGSDSYYQYSTSTQLTLDGSGGTSKFRTDTFDSLKETPPLGYDPVGMLKDLDNALRLCNAMS